jgi:hypothetical protein
MSLGGSTGSHWIANSQSVGSLGWISNNSRSCEDADSGDDLSWSGLSTDSALIA